MAYPSTNTTWDQLEIGATASIERRCTQQDLILFAHVSGNLNPGNLPEPQAASGSGPGADAGPPKAAPSMWVGSLVSAVLGNLLPGPGTVYRSQDLSFPQRVHVGDVLQVSVTCIARQASPLAVFSTCVRRRDGTVVCEGQAVVEVPLQTQAIEPRQLPAIIVDQADHFARLIERARTLPPMVTAVVCPEDAHSMGGVLLSARQGLIRPVLIGDAQRIRDAAQALGAELLPDWPLIQEREPRSAAARAVAMARAGEVEALMKGALHSDDLLAVVVNKEQGLRGHRRISHVFVMDVPTLPELLFISDAAINIAPDLMTKVDIVQNAIDVARACGLERPRVGILSAVENINPAIPSTLDAAILSKMAERGQIRGATVDGPLAMDNAIDLDAARTKGIESLVAGRAQVLIVPNLEAGNMLAKELTFVARAEAAGLVVGAQVPVMLTSRADNDRARLASCALARLHEFWRREGRAHVEGA